MRHTCRCDTSEGLPKLEVNFDPALVVVLREVRYFLGMRNPSINIPAVGLKVLTLLHCLRVYRKYFHDMKADSPVADLSGLAGA